MIVADGLVIVDRKVIVQSRPYSPCSRCGAVEPHDLLTCAENTGVRVAFRDHYKAHARKGGSDG